MRETNLNVVQHTKLTAQLIPLRECVSHKVSHL
jgi:hypothetical protein